MPRPLNIGSWTAIAVGIGVAVWIGTSRGPGSAGPAVPDAALVDVPPATATPSPVEATLLSDVEIIQPGNLIRLGVRLRVRPGWHLVATADPDDSPTRVEFHLPDRFTAGPARWPEPVPFTAPGGGSRLGYRDRVVMYREVRASNLDPDRDWHLTARVHWLACERACEPGETTVELWLPASISGTRLQNWRNIRLFDEWAPRLVVERP